MPPEFDLLRIDDTDDELPICVYAADWMSREDARALRDELTAALKWLEGMEATTDTED